MCSLCGLSLFSGSSVRCACLLFYVVCVCVEGGSGFVLVGIVGHVDVCEYVLFARRVGTKSVKVLCGNEKM